MTASPPASASSDWADTGKLGTLGALSGGLSWLLVDNAQQLHLDFQFEGFGLELLPIAIFPGLVFGVVIGLALGLAQPAGWLRVVGYVLAAGLAYVAAFHVAFYSLADVFSDTESALGYVISGLPAGLVGSLLLGLLTRLLFAGFGTRVLHRSVIVGTLAGALLGLGSIEAHNGLGFLAFFVLWQGAYGASLAELAARRAPPGAAMVSDS